jgi:hypothetical protein
LQKESAARIGITRQNAMLNETGEFGAPQCGPRSLVEPERLRRQNNIPFDGYAIGPGTSSNAFSIRLSIHRLKCVPKSAKRFLDQTHGETQRIPKSAKRFSDEMRD